MKIYLLLIFLLFLAACAPSPAAIGAAIAETQSAWTSIPSQTYYPTYTLYPTYTPIPSPTLTATPQINTEMVIAAFKAAGLEAESPSHMTKDDYGVGPYVCDGTRFLIPSLGPDRGGRIFICGVQDEQNSLADYYISLGKQSAMFFSWVFIKDQVLVQINGSLPEDTAHRYESAIP